MEIEFRLRVRVAVEAVGDVCRATVLEVAQEQETAKEAEGQLELFANHANPVAEVAENAPKEHSDRLVFTRPVWVKFSDKREMDKFSTVKELCTAVSGSEGRNYSMSYKGCGSPEGALTEFKRLLNALVRRHSPWRSVDKVVRETKDGRRYEA